MKNECRMKNFKRRVGAFGATAAFVPDHPHCVFEVSFAIRNLKFILNSSFLILNLLGFPRGWTSHV